MDALNVWEQEVTKYEAKGEDLSEDIKLAVVTRSLPEPMRGHIVASLNNNAATTYLQLRNRIEEFVLTNKAWGKKDKDRDESTAPKERERTKEKASTRPGRPRLKANPARAKERTKAKASPRRRPQ